ncbi:MAG: hypothetical protein M1335_03110 [Chloroflexi bacterium]|nr:hypothetical protein [Chloroflexota bacterium]
MAGLLVLFAVFIVSFMGFVMVLAYVFKLLIEGFRSLKAKEPAPEFLPEPQFFTPPAGPSGPIAAGKPDVTGAVPSIINDVEAIMAKAPGDFAGTSEARMAISSGVSPDDIDSAEKLLELERALEKYLQARAKHLSKMPLPTAEETRITEDVPVEEAKTALSTELRGLIDSIMNDVTSTEGITTSSASETASPKADVAGQAPESKPKPKRADRKKAEATAEPSESRESFVVPEDIETLLTSASAADDASLEPEAHYSGVDSQKSVVEPVAPSPPAENSALPTADSPEAGKTTKRETAKPTATDARKVALKKLAGKKKGLFK